MAVGPNEMVNLDSVEAWPDERPAQGAAGDNLLRASAASGFTEGIKSITRRPTGAKKTGLVSERLTFLPRTRED